MPASDCRDRHTPSPHHHHHHRHLLLRLFPSLLLAFLAFPLLAAAASFTQGPPPPPPGSCPNEEPARCAVLMAREDLDCNTTLCCGNTEDTLVSELCPISCGRCSQPCFGMKCKNYGVMNYDTCTCECPGHLGGLTCEKCVEQDEPWCTNFLPKSLCGQPGGPMFQLCPHFCGLCPETCNGDECQNHGVLNINTCSCQCVGVFTGTFCEVCPEADADVCDQEDPATCQQTPFVFASMQTTCPYMCGNC